MDESIVDKIKLEERRSIKRMFYCTCIPIIITIVLISFSYIKVNEASKTVEKLNQQIDALNKELKLKSDSLKFVQETYEFAITYEDKRFKLGYSIDKYLFSLHPIQTAMLEEIRELIDYGNVKWKLGGHSVEDGFDSPSFASYLVNKYSKITIPNDKIYVLYDYLQIKEEPKTGDLIIYEHGYTMIYFENYGTPFCVGMTPIGLSSLEIEFGPRILGYFNIDY